MSRDHIRVAIVDDADVVRMGLRHLFDSVDQITVVAEASSVAEADPAIAQGQPDVVLLDVMLPDGNGIELCGTLTAGVPAPVCILLSDYVDQRSLADAARAGAAAYLTKDTRGHLLVEAVRQAGTTGIVDLGELDQLAKKPQTPSERRLAVLSPQEQRVAHLIAEGCTNRRIAAELGLSENTVRNYITNMLSKLGLRRRTQILGVVARARVERAEAVLPPSLPERQQDQR